MLNDKFWDKYFKVYDVLNLVIPYQELLSKLNSYLEPLHEDIILDAGSGTGNLSILLSRSGATVYSLDFSNNAIKIHKKKSPNSLVFQGDLLNNFNFENGYFSKVVSNNVIYSIPIENRSHVMSEFFRVLKSGGILVISNVAKNWSPVKIYLRHIKLEFQMNGLIKTIIKALRLLPDTLKMFYYNSMIYKEEKINYNFPTMEEQESMLRDAGFTVIKSERTYADQAVITLARK